MVSLAFGALLLFLTQRLLTHIGTESLLWDPANPAALLGGILILLLGNPVFRALRQKNLIAVGFFVLLSFIDPTIAGGTGAVFTLLVTMRKLLHKLELQARDRSVVKMTLGSKLAAEAPVTKKAIRAKPRFWEGFTAGVEGKALTQESRISPDTGSWFTWDEGNRPPFPLFNPINGYPMLGAFDIAGNPYGFWFYDL
ncbi:hypothetical protein [Castellaniella sp.]|uniref:hypothetical protein n=1 Tax=Castellaniella sp. TaxID=1955812 RepID=UPI002AFF4CAD|nr:hypothetical protein [Castellaniella sp.]